jgi:hypothetical protein
VLLLKAHHDIATDITDYIEPVRRAAELITCAAPQGARPMVPVA